MRTRILTSEEEAVLKAFLERDEKLPRFYDLIYRIRKHGKLIKSHMELMNSAIQKFESK